ncbi:MAG: VanZ family protein [Acidobacteriota bacterium]|nr:VanZ family protein [Acidobacteriota bacterium]
MVNTAHDGDVAPNNSSVMRRVVRYGPLLVWIGFISFASTGEFSADNTSQIVRPILLWLFPNISEAALVSIHFLTRKAAHFCEYAVLAFLARRAFISSSKSVIRRHWFAISLALVVLNSLLDEFHQAFVPTRTGSIYDSAIDVLGGLIVLTVFRFYGKAPKEVGAKH